MWSFSVPGFPSPRSQPGTGLSVSGKPAHFAVFATRGPRKRRIRPVGGRIGGPKGTGARRTRRLAESEAPEATVAISRSASLPLAAPIATASARFGDVGADARLLFHGEHRSAVEAPCLLPAPRAINRSAYPRLIRGFRIREHVLEDRRHFIQRRLNAGGAGPVGRLNRHLDDRAGIHLDGMPGLVYQIRTAIFHPRNLRNRIVQIHSVGNRSILLALAIQPRTIRSRRRLDARSLGQTFEEFVIVLACIVTHYSVQDGVGFQRCRVDLQRLTPEQPRPCQHAKHLGEDGFVCLHIDRAVDPRDRQVVRCRVAQLKAQKLQQSRRSGQSLSHTALRINALEVAGQPKPRIDRWSQRWPAYLRHVELCVLPLDGGAEALLGKRTRQAPLRMAPRFLTREDVAIQD